jgi:ankyrin repeat protein
VGTVLSVVINNHRKDLDMLKLLLEHGADVNRITPSTSSPLLRACLANDTETAHLLTEPGANVNDTKNKWTPLHGTYHSVTVTRLLHDADASVDQVPSESGHSPLLPAAPCG